MGGWEGREEGGMDNRADLVEREVESVNGRLVRAIESETEN